MDGTAVRMDIVESGNTIMACKMLGMVPETHEVGDFNLYVRTVGSTVIVSRSDTDETIVSRVGFKNAMTSLANYYRLPVIIAADPGVVITKKAAELIGTYEPTLSDSGFRTLHGGEIVREGDVISVPALPDFEPSEILAFLPNRTIIRGVRSGLRSILHSDRYYCAEVIAKHTGPVGTVADFPGTDFGTPADNCVCDRIFADGPRFTERTCPCGAVFCAVERVNTTPGVVWFDDPSGTHWIVVRQAATGDVKFRDLSGNILTLSGMEFSVRVRDSIMIRIGDFVAPVIGARYLSGTGQTVHEITEVDGTTFVLANGTRCNTLSLSWWVRDGELIPVGTGYRRSFRKHKSTSVSRKRRGGAR